MPAKKWDELTEEQRAARLAALAKGRAALMAQTPEERRARAAEKVGAKKKAGGVGYPGSEQDMNCPMDNSWPGPDDDDAERVRPSGRPRTPWPKIKEDSVEDVGRVLPSADDGETERVDPEPTAERLPLDDFQRFCLSLDPETRELLSESELRDIWVAQQAKAEAEKKAAAKKKATDQALEHARIEAGLVPVATRQQNEWRRRMSEKVRFTVELPGMGDPDPAFRIDGKLYRDGETVTCTRAQYDSMRYTMYMAQQNELAFHGIDKRHTLRRQARGSMGRWVDGVGVTV